MTICSKLFLADLGGSEQVSKSKVDAGMSVFFLSFYFAYSAVSLLLGAIRTAGNEQQFSLGFELGERMRETVHINLGLLALKKCVEALNNRAAYVPFMDSKLTMVIGNLPFSPH